MNADHFEPEQRFFEHEIAVLALNYRYFGLKIRFFYLRQRQFQPKIGRCELKFLVRESKSVIFDPKFPFCAVKVPFLEPKFPFCAIKVPFFEPKFPFCSVKVPFLHPKSPRPEPSKTQKNPQTRAFNHPTIAFARRNPDIRRHMSDLFRQQTRLDVFFCLLGFLCDFFHERKVDAGAVEDLLNGNDLQSIKRLNHIGFELALLFGEGRHWSGCRNWNDG